MFVDEVKIYARAGKGGNGCVAFLREAFRPKGGPCGGNGGRGGDVILEADSDVNDLIAQYYQPQLIAERGENGKGKGMDGRSGRDLIVKVPCGTLVWRLSKSDLQAEPAESEEKPVIRYSGNHRPLIRKSADAMESAGDLRTIQQQYSHQKGELVADLTTPGQRFVLCRGGKGGLGNRNFATSVNQTPRYAQPGEPGEEGEFLLELRIIADIGLVGYPNAGKSTLLSAISAAKPKVAPYPFTTLHPHVGVVNYDDFSKVTVCDIPGLIEGAHKNVGLGHKFLRHIERCKGIVILIDMAGNDGRAPWDDYSNLLKELELYDPALLAKPRIVVANKMDEPQAESNLRKFKRRIKGIKALPISAAFDIGLDKFKDEIKKLAIQHALNPTVKNTW
ncbi:MAG: Obg family GTPase [Limisphaerales bacterium]